MLTDRAQDEYVTRIRCALQAAAAVARGFVPGTFEVKDNGGRNVITEVDRKVSSVLRQSLLGPGEGWLSEEDLDDTARLSQNVVWIVDPIDGTREFVDGIPEWCISVGLVIEGIAVVGGVCNPATGELFLGSLSRGVTYNDRVVEGCLRSNLDGAVVLASRQEYIRGEWACFTGKQFSIKPIGSVAYKLALVAAGLADATWTLSPKHEWDVAAGVALVNSAGGSVGCIRNADLRFNKHRTLLPGLAASAKGIWADVMQLVNGVEPTR
jgi:myo-inositol-1(or 4)-monophosphatase